MQGYMCRIATLGGKSLPDKNRESSYKGYIKWLCMEDMRQAWAIWLKHNVREAGVKLNKVGKAHDNEIKT